MNLTNLMKVKEVDAVLVTDLLNVKYLSGFTGTSGFALFVGEKKFFITDFRYASQVKLEVEKNGFEIIIENVTQLKKAGELLEKFNVKKIAVEDMSVTLNQFDEFKKNFPSNIEFIGLKDSFIIEREKKTPEEIEIIKEAIKISEKALNTVIPKIKIGMKETEVAAEIEYEMRKLGALKPSFSMIIASNERSALPHGVASEKLIEEGFLTIDYGCFYKGYASDITRTFYVGDNPTEKHIEIYNIVKEANEKAISSIKVGMTTKELDKIARDFIEEKGYGENFAHGLGHGIGLQIHEYPVVSYKGVDKKLEPGMVITVEPGIYIPEFGGVRIEDDILITENSYEVLTNLDKSFKKL